MDELAAQPGADRCRSARLLLETTGLPLGDVAFAAGFAGERALDDAVRAAFARTPAQLRARARGGSGDAAGAPGALTIRLSYRAPLCPDNLFGHLAATAVPGVEEWRDGAYRRTLRLPHGPGVVALTPEHDHIGCRLVVTDRRDLATAIARCRHLLDLDADPGTIDAALGSDPDLAALVRAHPGRRVPRTVDGAEFAVRAVLGQQVSTAAARTHAARLVLAHGTPVDDPEGGLTHLFPEPADLVGLDPETLAFPRSRRITLTTLVATLADGGIDLDADADRQLARRRLAALPGVGPWTVEVIAMRALGDPDAFLPGDLGVRIAARRLGLPEKPRPLTARAAVWRPWRAYAVQHLWGAGDHAVNWMPGALGQACGTGISRGSTSTSQLPATSRITASTP